ncbi:MAG: cache and HAMP domain-containing protein [Patescibacteria group bacterium]|jgi:HAMP domain-containing protein
MGALRADIKISQSEHLGTIINERSEHIETYLDEIKSFTKLTASDEFISGCLSENGHATSPCVKNELSMYLLKNKFPLIDNLIEIYLLDSKGTLIASSFLNTALGGDLSKSQEFLNGRSIPYISAAYLNSSNANEADINVAVPVINNTKIVGVAVSRFRFNKISDIVTDPTALGNTGESYLINKDGQRLTAGRFSNQALLERISNPNTLTCLADIKKYGGDSDAVESHNEEQARYKSPSGDVIIGGHGYVKSQQWCFLVEMMENEVTEPVDNLGWVYALTGLGVMGAVTGFAFFLSGRISRTMKELLRMAQHIESGNYESSSDTLPNNEVGQMASVLEQIDKKLKAAKAPKKHDDTPTATPWSD